MKRRQPIENSRFSGKREVLLFLSDQSTVFPCLEFPQRVKHEKQNDHGSHLRTALVARQALLAEFFGDVKLPALNVHVSHDKPSLLKLIRIFRAKWQLVQPLQDVARLTFLFQQKLSVPSQSVTKIQWGKGMVAYAAARRPGT